MGWRPVDFGLCRPVHFWQAVRGLTRVKNERFEFEYNIARLTATSLVNIQLNPEDRISPNQLWPDWGVKIAAEDESELIDPVEIVQKTHTAIEFLNRLEISIIENKKDARGV